MTAADLLARMVAHDIQTREGYDVDALGYAKARSLFYADIAPLLEELPSEVLEKVADLMGVGA